MKTIQTRRGGQIPVIGLGTWKLVGDEARTATATAIQLGYRHIDCASIYGNQAEIGAAFRSILQTGTVQRGDLWVTSKLWNDCHQVDQVRPALEKTLRDLTLDYLDLYLMHWPIAHVPGVIRPENGEGFLTLEQVPLSETWQAMEACRQAGLCREVGVSNFSLPKLKSLIAATGVTPSALQVESHPLLPQTELFEFCRQQQIAYTAYSPLGSGDRPEAMKRENEPNLLNEPAVQQIAAAHAITPAQVLLAWAVQRGTVAIPKSANPERQKQNLASADIALTPTEMASLGKLDRHYRFVDGTFWEQPGGPYTARNIWDD